MPEFIGTSIISLAISCLLCYDNVNWLKCNPKFRFARVSSSVAEFAKESAGSKGSKQK
jgi:hypothetical protein